MLGDPATPLVITEGPLKADAAVSAGFAAVDLLGVWGWRGRNESGGSLAIADWEYVALKDRQVVLAFDSDVMLKSQVYEALRRLASLLKQRGAAVLFAYLPHGDAGAKVGLDDWFAMGHSAEEFWSIVVPELRHSPSDAIRGGASEPPETFDDVPDESGSELLDEVERFITSYVVLPGDCYGPALALWVLHTYASDAFDSTPRLAFLSPEKRSGKSRALEVLDLLTYRPLRTANASAAAIFGSPD